MRVSSLVKGRWGQRWRRFSITEWEELYSLFLILGTVTFTFAKHYLTYICALNKNDTIFKFYLFIKKDIGLRSSLVNCSCINKYLLQNVHMFKNYNLILTFHIWSTFTVIIWLIFDLFQYLLFVLPFLRLPALKFPKPEFLILIHILLTAKYFKYFFSRHLL